MARSAQLSGKSGLFFGLTGLVHTLRQLAANVRRLHDAGRSATPADSKAAMMIKQPALAAQRGPFWMPTRGPNPTLTDTGSADFRKERREKLRNP
jgi:hypothetical protein